MIRKALIAYATAGIGHKKAALAIKKAFDEVAPKDVEVSIIDSLDYTNALFKWTYLNIYLLMVNRLPLLWGFLYHLTDNFYFNLIIKRLRRFNNWLNSFKLAGYLRRARPDVIVSTHFFVSEVVSDLKKNGLLDAYLITVITDYRLHSWWVSDYIDTYVVGSEDAKEDLLEWNIAPSRIKTLGIPVEPIFSKRLARDYILKRIGLREGVFTILVIGGGFGVGPIEGIMKILIDLSSPVQVIAICGHNKELAKRLESLRQDYEDRIKILGFVDNVYEYMEISDILISKSGGITVTESLAKELPMIVISPILGQETRNSEFLTRHDAAIEISKLSDLKVVLEDLASHPERIEKMKDAIKMIRRPMACYDIAKLAIEMAHKL